MTTEVMNIHRALAELKLLDTRIDKEIDSAMFCTSARGTEKKLAGMTVDEYKASSASAWDKINDLIKRRDAIKSAIAKSNAQTMVKLGDKEYTVAELIYQNAEGIEKKKLLLDRLHYQYSTAVKNMELKNAGLADRADEFALRSLGGDSKDKASVDPDKLNAFRQTYIEQNSWSMFDGIDSKSKIEALQTEIDKFTAEVDSALSVSNANTQITIEY